MMTREEFTLNMQYIQEFSRGWSEDTYRIYLAVKDHDAEQRAEIARLAEWQRIVLGTGTDQEAVIRMAAAEYTKTAIQCWKEKCAQQEQEIERLREVLKDCLAPIQDDIKELGPCEHDVNICVCPLKILAAKVQQALKETTS